MGRLARLHLSVKQSTGAASVVESVDGQGMRCTIPSRDQVEPETPLRLSMAAALAFPDGSMTASGLRREAARGRLVIGLQEGSRQDEARPT